MTLQAITGFSGTPMNGFDGYNMVFRYARHCSVIIKNAIHGKGVNILTSRKLNSVPRGRDRRIFW